MVGLSIVLEAQKSHRHHHQHNHRSSSKQSPQILSKASMLKPRLPSPPPAPPPPTASFLEACYLCRKKLSPESDIYMYRGDRAFCSEECRCRQMCMEEEEDTRREKLYFSAAASSSSSTHRHRERIETE